MVAAILAVGFIISTLYSQHWSSMITYGKLAFLVLAVGCYPRFKFARISDAKSISYFGAVFLAHGFFEKFEALYRTGPRSPDGIPSVIISALFFFVAYLTWLFEFESHKKVASGWHDED